MKIPFRQGIVSYQAIGGIPDFLDVQPTFGGKKVNLKTENGSTIIAFAHGNADYLYVEPQQAPITGWAGPFLIGTDYWIYWDINKNTGIRTFGSTLHSPTFGPQAPHSPLVNQHWFDTIKYQMKVWQGSAWIVVIRVFAGHLVSGGTSFTPNGAGTQVGLSGTNIDVGQILFGNDGKVVKKHTGEFFTTSERFYTGGSSVNAISLDNTILNLFAVENIAQYNVVKIVGENQVGVAKYSETNNFLLGMSLSNTNTIDSATVLMQGVITNPLWNWTAGEKLWVSESPIGVLTNVDPSSYDLLLVPQSFVARAISSTTITFIQPIGQKGDTGTLGTTVIEAAPTTVIPQTIWVPGLAMYSSIDPLTSPNGAAIVARNLSGGDEQTIPQVVNMALDIGSSLQFIVSFPGDWVPSTIKFTALWMVIPRPTPLTPITGTRVRFQLEGITIVDEQLLNIPYGPPILTERHVQPNVIGYTQYKTPESPAILINGTSEVNGVTYFRLTRVPATADDINQPITLIGINIQYSTTLGSTADVTPPAP